MNKGRKISGGKYHALRKKKLSERVGQARNTSLGDTKAKKLRMLGGKNKTVLLKANIANVLVEGKTKKVEILKVLETPQNRFLARQNRLMKSAIIETSAGKARITNRPTQEGQVNAILVKA
jgi:small subunit ribosomal protein S8e